MILSGYRQEIHKKDAPQRSHEKYLSSIHEAGARRETAYAHHAGERLMSPDLLPAK